MDTLGGVATGLEAGPPPAVVGAARVMRVVAWLGLAVPAAALVYTFPVGFVLLLFGGAIVVAPPVALAIIGFRLSKSLRTGRRRIASALFAFLQGLAVLALAVHSTTWDPATPGAETFYRLFCFFLFVVGAASLSIPVLIMWGDGARREQPREHKEHELALDAPLWPWLLGAAAILLLGVLFGWVVPFLG